MDYKRLLTSVIMIICFLLAFFTINNVANITVVEEGTTSNIESSSIVGNETKTTVVNGVVSTTVEETDVSFTDESTTKGTTTKGATVKSPTTNAVTAKTTVKTTVKPTVGKTTTRPTTATTTTTAVVDEVDAYRKQLENTYGVKIYYGNELTGYKPMGVNCTRLTNPDEIKESLKGLELALKAYPSGFFKDFKNFNMPLSFFLVDNAGGSFAGFTDSEFLTNIKVTLIKGTFLTQTANHELMHCIDKYIELKMYPNVPYTEYKTLNPAGFSYVQDGGNSSAYTQYCYPNATTTSGELYFVSTYSLTAVREDRAEIFKYMMRSSYIPTGVMNANAVTTKKADIIHKQIKQYFPSASNGISSWMAMRNRMT
ncbi:MAG: hypothetical protein PUD72_06290 [Oscillospiraceae bacterium]|nr:hypothetical protein [Oscillospiraceae bacterium]